MVKILPRAKLSKFSPYQICTQFYYIQNISKTQIIRLIINQLQSQNGQKTHRSGAFPTLSFLDTFSRLRKAPTEVGLTGCFSWFLVRLWLSLYLFGRALHRAHSLKTRGIYLNRKCPNIAPLVFMIKAITQVLSLYSIDFRVWYTKRSKIWPCTENSKLCTTQRGTKNHVTSLRLDAQWIIFLKLNLLLLRARTFFSYCDIPLNLKYFFCLFSRRFRVIQGPFLSICIACILLSIFQALWAILNQFKRQNKVEI